MRKLIIIEKTFLYKTLVIYKIIHLAHIKDAPKDYYPFIIDILLLSSVAKILYAFLEVWEVKFEKEVWEVTGNLFQLIMYSEGSIILFVSAWGFWNFVFGFSCSQASNCLIALFETTY